MAQADKTFIALSVDASGSMRSYYSQVANGIADFISEQRDLDTPAEIYMTQFDEFVRPMMKVCSLHDPAAHKWKYKPEGYTAIYDAFGKTTEAIVAYINSLPENKKPSRVIVILVTDGLDNRSVVWTKSQIADLVKHYEDIYEWDFLFIGANQDAYKEATRLGIKSGKILSMAASTTGITEAFRSISKSVLRYRQDGAPRDDEFFTHSDKTVQQQSGAAY